MGPKGLGLDSLWGKDDVQILGLKIPDDDVPHAGDPEPCALGGQWEVSRTPFFSPPLCGYWGSPRFSHNLKSQGHGELDLV
jgi:hypothetical protein